MEEWEEQFHWERLTRLTHTTYEQLIHHLLSAVRELLGNILFYEHSQLAADLPKAADTSERWRVFIQSATEKEVDPRSLLQHLETTERLIPADYDVLSEAQKLALIKECLSHTASLYYGYKPEVWRSEVVEAYLKYC